MNKIKVVFFGTPDFSVPALEMLYNHAKIDLKYVVSMPDRKQGRGMEMKSPEVIEFAKNNKIPFFQTQNINQENDFLQQLRSEGIDIFVVLAFAQFLNQELLSLPRLGCFNIHTSLLPKYRGAAPIQYALLNGDQETGVSIQKMVKKMDAGDIAHSSPIAIASHETGGQLYTRLKFLAALCLNEFIEKLLENKVEFSPQNEDHVSFAPTLKREDGVLEFNKLTTDEAFNKIRALFPWPGTHCFLNGKRLKILTANYSELKVAPGQVNTDSNKLIVGCTDGSLRLSQVQLAGKKASSDIELLNGIKGDIVISTNEGKKA
ncbi:MAG: methionyl-tRNA formyltransferase [Halobacteriovoraceae bacterium]|nr:methionyl-tRNA formyltransferase [Halobacteriovoraceae bacterium]|tara:strand:+ start:9340 stop:10293 length:954 start_codon:yes stop_codon:yes gene_type:complete